MKNKEKSIYLNFLLVVLSAILKPHKNSLRLIKIVNRTLAVSVAGFISYKVAPLVPGAASEVIQGLVPAPMVLVTISYLLLMYAGSLTFWRAADNCTIQLKTRFNIDP